MTDKDFDNDEVRPDGGGSEAHVSDPASHQDDLTVDDILGADQTDDALTGDDAVDLPPEAAGYLADLKRLTAEYANYRRRTEDQRQLEIERARGEAAKSLLPVLDDLDRAEKHGDLEEGSAFTVITEKVRGAVAKLGVTAYGAAGDVFDPQQHEAIFQVPTPGQTAPTIVDVAEVGYRLGDVELRPAKVVVAVPADPSTSSGT
ncbi:nucleotide exchange factor GrpE [Microbacterium sp. NPDC055910]|uniref:nucleotide exchange factor GrpE n=1 Tax=Microbacterium sp. NPDC055910 TaxID=3345659 RepID=UPI0035D7D014